MIEEIKQIIEPREFDYVVLESYNKESDSPFTFDKETFLDPLDFDYKDYICQYGDYYFFLCYDEADNKQIDGKIFVSHKSNLHKNMIEINGKKYMEVENDN